MIWYPKYSLYNALSDSCRESQSQKLPGDGRIFDRIVKNFPPIKVAQ